MKLLEITTPKPRSNAGEYFEHRIISTHMKHIVTHCMTLAVWLHGDKLEKHE